MLTKQEERKLPIRIKNLKRLLLSKPSLMLNRLKKKLKRKLRRPL
jgi:hypothetical protein